MVGRRGVALGQAVEQLDAKGARQALGLEGAPGGGLERRRDRQLQHRPPASARAPARTAAAALDDVTD